MSERPDGSVEPPLGRLEAFAAASESAPTLSFYAIAIGVSIFFPVLAVALYFAIALWLTVPAGAVRHILRRSS